MRWWLTKSRIYGWWFSVVVDVEELGKAWRKSFERGAKGKRNLRKSLKFHESLKYQ
jgi:hypothetical protein